jgi:hypothetical protein
MPARTHWSKAACAVASGCCDVPQGFPTSALIQLNSGLDVPQTKRCVWTWFCRGAENVVVPLVWRKHDSRASYNGIHNVYIVDYVGISRNIGQWFTIWAKPRVMCNGGRDDLLVS